MRVNLSRPGAKRSRFRGMAPAGAASLLITAVLAAACNDSPSNSGTGEPPAITILAGASGSDSVDAPGARTLQIEVSDDGKVVQGVAVAFAPVFRPSGAAQVPTMVLLGGASPVAVSATTDERGRAQVSYKYGTLATDRGGIVISVPTLNLVDTAQFIISPGQAARLDAAPQDTTIANGAAYTLRTAVFDRHNNPRSDGILYEVLSGSLQVEGDGRVTAQAPGRASIRLQARSLVDTVFVTVQ